MRAIGTRIFGVAAFAAALANGAFEAKAYTIGNTYNITLNQWVGQSFGISWNGGAAVNTIAAAFDLRLDDTAIPGVQSEKLVGYCSDLLDWWNQAATTQPFTAVAVANPSGANATPNPNWVAGGASKAAWIYNNYGGGSLGTTQKGGALALAIWDALYDNGDGLGVTALGKFVVTSGDATTIANANAMLLAAAGKGAEGTWFTPADERLHQGIIVGVPAPESVLASLGFIALAFVCRRQLRAE